MNTNYASPWIRVLAGAVNCSLNTAVTLLALLPIVSAGTTEKILGSFLTAVVFLIYLAIIKPLVFSYMVSRFGGTPGDLLVGISVVNENGGNLGFGRSLFRTFIGSSVAWVFMGLGYVYMFIDEKKRGWHDIVAESVVVKKRSVILPGILVFVILLITNISIVSSAIAKVASNTSLYKGLISEIMTSAADEFDRPKPSDESNLENQIDESWQTFESEDPDIKFEYPTAYDLQVVSNGQNGTPVYIYIDTYPQKTSDISIITENLNTDYPAYIKNKRLELCPSGKDICGMPMAGLVPFDTFEVLSDGEYSKYAFIPNLSQDIVYVISMKKEATDQRFSMTENEIFDKLIFTFENDFIRANEPEPAL